MIEDQKDSLTAIIIGCCYQVHNELGPGFLEKIYANALKIKLKQAGLLFMAEKEFDVIFENVIIGKFRCDLLVENKVIVELKSVAGFQPKLFQSQLLSYLKASKIKTGLLINFGNTSCEVKRLSV
ncbi:GxxExxY protein [Pedobacter sp. GR22-10]|jgi:GxxExxY protein|uniref:GxxExxY protein n=1 Tax=Pedobacter sp. GR22-10 TaxID=2994472 RepID=UPI00224864C7|nr:GxxExxY protein [Pedobacter sp. GR22-10]MCX2432622.1 GxxExxY protein [Pedobacter sp. GR22-10]